MEKQILIFRTSVSKKHDIAQINKLFKQCSRIEKWSVDFEDWEKVLRVEGINLNTPEIAGMLREIKIHVVELE